MLGDDKTQSINFPYKPEIKVIGGNEALAQLCVLGSPPKLSTTPLVTSPQPRHIIQNISRHLSNHQHTRETPPG